MQRAGVGVAGRWLRVEGISAGGVVGGVDDLGEFGG